MKTPCRLFGAIILMFAPLISKSPNKTTKYPFQNFNLTFEQRVDNLVSQMTLDEKVSQMLNSAPAIPRLGIPAYDWWNETLHGVARTPYTVTVYPQAIAMAATFDRNSSTGLNTMCLSKMEYVG